MALKRLDITNFRNLISVNLEALSPKINFLYGVNGSGKTSFLEVLYYLSLGRSFRGTKADRIINNQAEKFSIFAQVETLAGQTIPLGMEREQNGEIKLRLAGKNVHSIAELAELLPVLLINSHCHHMLDLGPVFRRKYIDWGVFYHVSDFLRIWRQYERALKQRNAALRGQVAKTELSSWSKELIAAAVQLDFLRKEYLQQLIPILLNILAEILVLPHLEIVFYPGWSHQLSFEEALTQSSARDEQLGYTQVGPHRADLKIMIDGVPAKDILSRGQQKLFVCAMMLAQGTLLQQATNNRPIYLLDDLPSELDNKGKSKLLGLLLKQEAQVFVTAIDRDVLDFLIQSAVKMFHVEHGDIKPVPALNKCVEIVE